MDDGAQQAGFARDLLALLRDQVAQMAAQQAASSAALARQTELSLALVNQLNAPAVAPALRETAVAPCAAASAPVPVRGAAIDDPEMEAALLAHADREGWWDDDAEEVLEQFDWMLVGLITLQGEYVRYCARKGLDPTTALPSIARLAAKLEETATATGAAAAGPEATDVRHAPPTSASPAAMPDCARSMDRTPGSPRAPTQAAPGEATRRRSNLLVSEIFERYLAMRMTGCKVDPEREVPSPKIGAKFAQTMRPNIEGTQRPIVEILGDRPLEALGAVEWKTFVDTLPRVPRNHGTSSRDKRNRPPKAACTPPS